MGDLRRYSRLGMRAPVRVSWVDRYGNQKYTTAKTIDISEAGIRVELPEAVEIRGLVGVQAERLGVTSSGSVRNCVRCGSKYLVGIEFYSKIKLSRALATLTTELVSR